MKTSSTKPLTSASYCPEERAIRESIMDQLEALRRAGALIEPGVGPNSTTQELSHAIYQAEWDLEHKEPLPRTR